MKKTFALEELDCANCAAKLERAVAKIEGVRSVTVSFLTQKLTLEADDGQFDEIFEQVVKTFRKIEPDWRHQALNGREKRGHMSKKQKRILIRILIAAALTAGAWLAPLDGVWKAAAFAAPYLVIGCDVLWGSLRNILHGQVFDEMFLMSVATLGAFAIGEYPEAAAVMLFYQIVSCFRASRWGRAGAPSPR